MNGNFIYWVSGNRVELPRTGGQQDLTKIIIIIIICVKKI